MNLSYYLKRFIKHRKYLYVSFILIIAFFIGSSLITPKITSVTSELIAHARLEDLYYKKNNITSEFSKLNSFLLYSKKTIRDNSENSFSTLIAKLDVASDFALSSNVNINSFLYVITPTTIKETAHIKPNTSLKKIPAKTALFNSNYGFLDTLITSHNKVLNRKAYIYKKNTDTTIIVGYDVDLKSFWKYFSEKYNSRISYTVILNKDGICMLHPEKKNIGKKLDRYFTTYSISDILKTPKTNNTKENATDILKIKAKSRFLDLGVLRYFDKIKIGNSPFIITVNFVEFYKENTKEIQQYFLWISLLAFITFMLLLLLSRIQLKKEYKENIRVLKEKEQLAIANENYQKENAVLQLNQLKKKMSPHFLFNTLNSLHFLIETKPNLSQKFVVQLANVYRYLLENRDDNLTTLKKELDFLDQYIFLHKIRFKDSLNIKIINNSDDDLVLYKKIPVLALETLVENAIKHNKITKNNPLNIEIEIKNTKIIVSNNYSPKNKKTTKSHKIGLTYLKNIYDYYEVDSFKTKIIAEKFICVLPLLSQN